jgi:predicted  nucleic acid-binding Zn-ribbon protein
MRSVLVFLAAVLSITMAGCSSDPNETEIANTIQTLRGTTNSIEAITKTLTEAVAQAKKDGKSLALDKIAQATEETDALKKQAKDLQRWKAATEARKDQITKDQKEDYAQRYKTTFQAAVQELYAAQTKLNTVLSEADVESKDGDSKGGMEKLREKLKECQGEFEVLTKKQS